MTLTDAEQYVQFIKVYGGRRFHSSIQPSELLGLESLLCQVERKPGEGKKERKKE